MYKLSLCGYGNTFINNNGANTTYNSSHAQVRGMTMGEFWNHWDDGICFGNYWSDWTSPDNNGDGIVDNPYPIGGSANNYDYKPRTTQEPFTRTPTVTTTTTTKKRGSGFSSIIILLSILVLNIYIKRKKAIKRNNK